MALGCLFLPPALSEVFPGTLTLPSTLALFHPEVLPESPSLYTVSRSAPGALMWRPPAPWTSIFLAPLPSLASLELYLRTRGSCEHSQSMWLPRSQRQQTAWSCTVELSVAGGRDSAESPEGPEAPPTGSPPHLAESPDLCLSWNGPSPISSKSLCPVFLVSPTLNPNSPQLLLQSKECPCRRASFNFLAT